MTRGRYLPVLAVLLAAGVWVALSSVSAGVAPLLVFDMLSGVLAVPATMRRARDVHGPRHGRLPGVLCCVAVLPAVGSSLMVPLIARDGDMAGADAALVFCMAMWMVCLLPVLVLGVRGSESMR